MESIITIGAIDTTARQFTDPRLAKHTERIIHIYKDAQTFADKKNREIASILSTIKTEKSYEKDGFLSVADYAEKTFSIKRAQAYSLAAAGDVYNDTKASELMKSLTPSKLAELASVKPEIVESALKSGEISPSTSQADLRTFAARQKPEEKKVEIAPHFTAHAVNDAQLEPVLSGVQNTLDYFHNFVKESVAFSLQADPETIEVHKLPAVKVENSSAKVERYLYLTRCSATVVEYSKVVKSKRTRKNGPVETRKLTREELMKMLAELDAEGK